MSGLDLVIWSEGGRRGSRGGRGGTNDAVRVSCIYSQLNYQRDSMHGGVPGFGRGSGAERMEGV